MSGTGLALPSDPAPTARAGLVSQATAVEQSRAVAEVQAAVIVAQQCPRDMARALAEMRESCAQERLAERAFYKYTRAGNTIAGASVSLARELARCFGNVDYGIRELRRYPDHSEMQAWAWDIERNTRSTSTFVVPHTRDRSSGKGGAVPLTENRDIYENNANAGARRLREAIFAILPTWFTEEAKDRCQTTIEKGGGKSLPQRVADAIAHLEGVGVKLARLEAKHGPSGTWTATDLAQLTVSYQSIRQGTVTADDEFPAAKMTAAEVLAGDAEVIEVAAEPPAGDADDDPGRPFE